MRWLSAVIGTWVLCVGCGSPDSTGEGDPCGPNGTCPPGLECEPISRRCFKSGSLRDAAVTGSIDAVADGPADAAPGPAYRWVLLGPGDCSANDVLPVTQGSAIPAPLRCDAAQLGKAAICWDGVNYTNAIGVGCTYKSLTTAACSGGANTGFEYECVLQPGGVFSTNVMVPASANIYGGGHGVPPEPGGGGAGVLPVLITLPPGTGRVLSVTGALGTVDFGPVPPNGADGIVAADPYTFPSYGGIAGPVMKEGRCPTGLFLDATEPMDPPSAAYVVQDGSVPSFTGIQLRQIFFIGDGLTGAGTGTRQTFAVPDTASRLFLGFMDLTTGAPGWYGDNTGSVALTVQVQ